MSNTQVWLITGSSRGLGRALSEAVLDAGHSLVATARNPRQLDDLVERFGDRLRAVELDVTDPQAAVRVVNETVRSFGRLDVLCNNAGYGNVGPIEDTSIEDFRDQIETNLFGAIYVTKAALPFMRQQRAGRILQLSSIGGRIGAMGRAPYSAAKFGVEGFSEVLAKETAPLGIKVTIIEPGGFRTDFAGTSTVINAGQEAYASTVGASAAFQRHFNGMQPGDPVKAARVILQIAATDDPPLRLLLGSDAVEGVEKADRAKSESDQKWRSLSLSTDFDT
jgi:NAD(P)-dependent dehydrogenase (short-subunit alcohol dehydrogenase family)